MFSFHASFFGELFASKKKNGSEKNKQKVSDKVPLLSIGFSGRPQGHGTPENGLSGTHTIPIIRIPKDTGIVWVPLTIFGGPMSLGVPENPIELALL